MNIFVSWSGDYSRAAAVALKEWLPLLFNPIDIFVSSESIRKGKRWPQEIAVQLEKTNFGIACLTHDNLEQPWLLFETGALSKLQEGYVQTLLLGGLEYSDVKEGPLQHFQHARFERSDFFRMIQTINEAQGVNKHSEKNLAKLFEKFWPDLDVAIQEAEKAKKAKVTVERSDTVILREVHELVNLIARNMPEPTPHNWGGFPNKGIMKLLTSPLAALFLPLDIYRILKSNGID